MGLHWDRKRKVDIVPPTSGSAGAFLGYHGNLDGNSLVLGGKGIAGDYGQ